MKRHIIFILGAALLVFTSCKQTCSNLDYVDPTIGSISMLLVPTRTTVHLPFQVVRWDPSRTDLTDDHIADFPLTLTSHRQQYVFGFLPIVGNVEDVWTYKQESDHEICKPYYYSVDLQGCTLSFAPEGKSGIVKVDYNAEGDRQLRLRNLNESSEFQLVDDYTLTGEATFSGMKAYTYIVSDTPLSNPQNPAPNDHRCLLISAGKDVKSMRIKYGISYISIEQAKHNLQHEIPDFDFQQVCQSGRKVWDDRLNRINVSGGTEAHKRVFYTAFYRCSERMVDINEYGQYYSAFDHQVHKTDQPFYTDNWIWDTHIALEPLETILSPAMEEHRLNSYVEMFKQAGEMPSFAIISGAWPAMTGNYVAVWMADCMNKGLDFDIATGYEGIRKNSLECTMLPWRDGPKCELDDFYHEHGYMPALHPGEEETCERVSDYWEKRQAVSITTANSYSDWAIAQVAHRLGKNADETLFLRKAANYKNVYNPATKLLWPKDKDGNWIEGVDPRYMARPYYTENNAYTFTWDVKHDIAGLAALMGGKKQMEAKLDELYHIPLGTSKFQFYYKLPDNTGMIGQYSIGNEPSFHIPYLYDYVGAPWKTQKRIHQVIDCYFNDGFLGMPGDEDGGGMSAFLVFSMMGFFPVTPGLPVYAIGSPFFEHIDIVLPSGKTFTIDAKGYSEENKYIQSAELNGTALEKTWFTHEELMQGGTLEFTMGRTPNKQWGCADEAIPPSSLALDLMGE